MLKKAGGGMQKRTSIRFQHTGRTFVAVATFALAWSSPVMTVSANGMSRHDNGATTRVSIAADGAQVPGGAESSGPRAVSTDGRLVVFRTLSNLDPNDTNGQPDIYVRDLRTQKTTLVSVTADGVQAAGGSNSASISANGRFVAFYAYPDTLVSNDTNGVGDIFVRDLYRNTTMRVSVATDGTQANGASGYNDPAQISANGRYVTFGSFASNLVPNDTNGRQDVFVRDLHTGTTTRVSVANGGVEGNGDGMAPAISANGRFVAFAANSTNLVTGDTNNAADIFVRDLRRHTTTRVSVATDGTQSDSESIRPTISDDGGLVAFEGWGAHLVTNDTNNTPDIYVRDLHRNTTTRVSVATDGTQANDQSRYASISGNGRFVAFQSAATNLDSLGSSDTNGNFDIFVKALRTGKITRENVTPQGGLSNGYGVSPSLNANGRYITFGSGGSDIVSDDTNNLPDVFLRQRF